MLPFQTENRQLKPRRFSLTRSPFAHRANGSLSFVVCPFVYEETNGLNGLTLELKQKCIFGFSQKAKI
jgi:hypothetical protein